MVRLLILVEGQTEALFSDNVLRPYLAQKGVFLDKASIVVTRNNPKGSNYKGGYANLDRITPQLETKLKSANSFNGYVTTLFDFYACGWRSATETITQVEERLKIAVTIGADRLIPYLQKHEYEGLLFSEPTILSEELDASKLKDVNSILQNFGPPEEINSKPETCPSARLKALFPSYDKVLHGQQIARKIGIDTMREKCPHFDKWISQLEELANVNQ
jgi:Domain of unknown function (DUF4276)